MTLTIEQITDIKRRIVDERAWVKSKKGMERAKSLAYILYEFAKVKDVGDAREMVAGEERRNTADFYTVRVKGSTSRQKLNERAVSLMKELEESGREPTDRERAILAKFSGYGGGLIDPVTGQKGSAYEYYTPKPVAEAVWGLLGDMGFKGGKVLDPSSGTGIFGATSPKNCVVDAVELSEQSGMVNKLVNDGPGYKTTISPFEEFASNTPDEVYDAVVTNVPFGTVTDRGLNRLKDESYRDEPLENYFILRSLEKLRPSGMAAFIVPPRCVSGKGGKPEELRIAASRMAEFIGAYRLPSGTFSSADTDTVTDIIFFRKFSEDARSKIDALREQNPQILVDAKVNWKTFTDGKYFESSEGSKYVIGEFQAKDETKFRDTDKIIFNGDLAAIVRELKSESRPLPKSRIDWSLLDTAETLPIEYHDGDTIRQGGRTYQMKDGKWVAMAATAVDINAAKLAENLRDPYAAFAAGVTLDSVKAAPDQNELNGWVREALQSLKGLPDEEAKALWNTGIVALSVRQVLEERKNSTGVKFIDEYKELSEAMQRLNITKAQISKASGDLKIALKVAYTHYNRKNKFSALWRGDVAQDVAKTEAVASALETPEMKLARIQYETKSPWLSVDRVREVKGEGWNPLEDSDYCISEDGKRVIKTSDYYVGNYGEFLTRIDAQIAGAKDEGVKAKLLRQKIDAESRVTRLDASKLKFNILTPWVTPEEKVAFLKKFVSVYACIDSETKKPDIQIKSPKSDRERILNRYGDYLKKSTVTLGGMSFDYGHGDELKKLSEYLEGHSDDLEKLREFNALKSEVRSIALKEMRTLIAEVDAQFNSWVHGNQTIMARITAEFNDVSKLRFKDEDDQSDIAIPGMKPSLKLHGYQASYVRKMGREFSGINGFGVGLGKTFTALASVQHVQAIGVKKKTIFVVPNSTLSNWRKEANSAYTDTSDCLFVGLREGRGGKMQVKSSAYVEDLWAIKENRHSKIFMTMEAFQMIRVTEDTINAYGDYMRHMDRSFAENEKKKDDEQGKGKLSKLLEPLFKPDSAAPTIEELGIDSIVIDEAHNYKNSVNVSSFGSARYLSLTEACVRGLDAQLKCWYIRGLTAAKDGVLLLTATPLTNSPLEIASMLTLAAGVERLNNASNIKGTDDFMSAICKITSEKAENVAGQEVSAAVFTGLNNLRVLRNAISQTVTVREAKDVGMTVHIPDREEKSDGVEISDQVKATIARYKGAYLYAREKAKRDGQITNKFGKPVEPDRLILSNEKLQADYEFVKGKFGEDDLLIAHPFNLLNKMTNVIMDPDLDERATFYTIPEGQTELAKKVIESFNKLKIEENLNRLSPHTKPENFTFVEKKKKKGANDDDDGVAGTYKVRVTAEIANDGRILVDTLDYDTQKKFEAIAEKAGLDLGVSIPPKLAALLKNFQNEQANPRGLISEDVVSPIVKQIIFCDILSEHSKISRLLAQKAGVSSSKIAVITGQTNGKPEEIQDVQDGFNAQGEDNKFNVVIANEKAEVGINLQKGTQAIHHLTVGWTPDSVEQRNGRGARQGNASEKVTIYYYEANGSFDKIKRTMLNKKSEWIGKVLDFNGGDDVEVEGGLSREAQEKLALSDGSDETLQQIQKEQEESLRRTRETREHLEQMTYVKTIVSQQKYLKENTSAVDEVKSHFPDLIRLYKEIGDCEKKMKEAKSDKALAKWTQKRNETQAAFDRLKADIEASVSVSEKKWVNGKTVLVPVEFSEIFNHAIEESSVNRMIGRLEGQYSYEYAAKDDGPLTQHWAEDQALAKSMIEESLKNLQAAKDNAGAIPASIVAAASGGKLGLDSAGCLLLPGMVIVSDGYPYFYTREIRISDKWEASSYNVKQAGNYYAAITPATRDKVGGRHSRGDGSFYAAKCFESFLGEDIVYPGEARYAEFAKMAAKAEDDANSPACPFSDLSPEVSQYRTKSNLVRHEVEGCKLPQPYFPYVVPERMAKGEAAMMIFEQQKAVVEGFDMYSYGNGDAFLVRQEVEVERIPGGEYDKNIGVAMRDFAVSHGVKFRFDVLDNGPQRDALLTTFINDFDKALIGNTEEEVLKNANDALTKLAPDIVFPADFLRPKDSWGENLCSRAVDGALAAIVDKITASIGDDQELLIVDANDRYQPSIEAAHHCEGEPIIWDDATKTYTINGAIWRRLLKLNQRAKTGVKLIVK